MEPISLVYSVYKQGMMVKGAWDTWGKVEYIAKNCEHLKSEIDSTNKELTKLKDSSTKNDSVHDIVTEMENVEDEVNKLIEEMKQNYTVTKLYMCTTYEKRLSALAERSKKILEMCQKVKMENLEESLTAMQFKAESKRRKSETVKRLASGLFSKSGELSSSLEEDADQMDPQRTTKTTESAPDSQEEALVATTATATATAPEVATEPEMGAAISEPPLSPTTLTGLDATEQCFGSFLKSLESFRLQMTSTEFTKDLLEDTKSFEPLNVKLQTTHFLDVTDVQSFAVIPSTGDVALYSSASGFHRFTLKESALSAKKIPDVCGHTDLRILPLEISDDSYVAISCWECKTVTLMNIVTGKTTTAFSYSRFNVFSTKCCPSNMCLGSIGILYAFSKQDPNPVMEIDCSTITFAGPMKTLQTGLRGCSGMCFVPNPIKAVVVSNAPEKIIRAISVERDEILWEVKGEVDGVICLPKGMLFYGQRRVIVVCDGSTERIIVLDPIHGSHLQTIPLPKMGTILDLGMLEDRLIVLHQGYDQKYKISDFKLS